MGLRVDRGQGGQAMVRDFSGAGVAVQARVNLTPLEQKTLSTEEQDKLIRERAKAALLEIAGRL